MLGASRRSEHTRAAFAPESISARPHEIGDDLGTDEHAPTVIGQLKGQLGRSLPALGSVLYKIECGGQRRGIADGVVHVGDIDELGCKMLFDETAVIDVENISAPKIVRARD